MEQNRVFDTSALIALLQDEPGAQEIGDLIERTSKAHQCLICVINLAEIWHAVMRLRQDGDEIIAHLSALNFVVIDTNWKLARRAAELKLHYKLGFADSYAAATASLHQCELITTDTDFAKLNREIKVRLIRRK